MSANETDVLDPERLPRSALEETRRDLGSANFEAQYQQQPVPQEGNLLKWAWFQSYDKVPTRAPNDHIVVSWDTATKDREVNNYSVGVVALVKPNSHVYVLDLIRERMDFPTLRKRVVEVARQHRATVNLIENAGSGTSLLQDLYSKIPVTGPIPVGEKMMRFQTVTPIIEQKQVYVPVRAPWLEAFRRKILSFPASANDDQVDALSQLLNWVRNRPHNGPLQGTYGAR